MGGSVEDWEEYLRLLLRVRWWLLCRLHDGRLRVLGGDGSRVGGISVGRLSDTSKFCQYSGD